MSSLWKHPNSPFWSACVTIVVGNRRKQTKRSCGTKDRRLAARIADSLEEAGMGRLEPKDAEEFLQKKVSDLPARRTAWKAFDSIFRETTGQGMKSETVRCFADQWLASIEGTVAAGTYQRYDVVVKRFLESLAGLAEQSMRAIKQPAIAAFRDAEAKRVAISSANVSLKIVRIMFNAAEANGLIDRNEARYVKTLKNPNHDTARRAFTLPELKRILEACDTEWRSMVLFGFYGGGIRLGDCARMSWRNVDLEAGQILYTAQKTGRRLEIPISTPLKEHLLSIAGVDDPNAPLHPKAFDTVAKQNGRAVGLSNQFYEILASAGMVKPRSHKRDKSKNGRAGKRLSSELSFHSLRHSTTSLLKRAGVGEAIAMDLVGHDSPEISRQYTSIDSATKLAALNKLPEI